MYCQRCGIANVAHAAYCKMCAEPIGAPPSWRKLSCLSILNPTFFAEHPNCPDGGPVSLHFLYSVRRVRVSLRPMRRFVGSGDFGHVCEVEPEHAGVDHARQTL